MPTQIPTYSICNLLNQGDNAQDCVVLDLKKFIDFQPNLVSSPHKHSFYQLLFVVQGKGQHFIDFQNFEINKGDLYFLAPGQVHRWLFDDSIQGFVINFSDVFFTSFLARRDYLDDFPFFMGNGHYSWVSMPELFEVILSIFQKIQEEYNICKECSWDLIRVYLLELFILSNKEINVKNNLLYESKHQFYLLRNFEKLIEEHYKIKRLPKQYAEILFVTPNHLNALCKKIKGRSAGGLIRSRILLESKRLLINSTLSISEIAYQLNFIDTSYFSRFFKKYTNISPEDFRKSRYDIFFLP